MKYIVILLLILSSSNFTACRSNTNVMAKNKVVKNQKMKFFITSLNGKNISKEKLYIIFDEKLGTANGFSGCNTFFSKYTHKENSISFDHPATTKMYCKESIALEKEFTTTLTQSKIRILEKDSLFLKDANTNIILSGVKSKQ